MRRECDDIVSNRGMLLITNAGGGQTWPLQRSELYGTILHEIAQFYTHRNHKGGNFKQKDHLFLG